MKINWRCIVHWHRPFASFDGYLCIAQGRHHMHAHRALVGVHRTLASFIDIVYCIVISIVHWHRLLASSIGIV
jgi:hypothetical protein